jgi:hypothetical protein
VILAAKWRVKYYAPGVSTAVADALIQTAKRFEGEKAKRGFSFGFKRDPEFCVAVDVSPRAIFDGWGDAEAIKRLWCYDVEQHANDAERWFYVTDALQIGILIADDETFLFTPLMKAKAHGWNGVISNYDLMLKEVEDDFRSSPIAKRLVSAEDIEALVNANLLTREEMEARIREMEAEIVQVRKDAEAEVKRVKEEAKTEIDAANTRAEEAEKRATKAEKNVENEKKKAAKEAVKKYTDPPVYDVDLSLEKFNLTRMSFKVPEKVLKELFSRKSEKDIEALKATLTLSEAELKQICEADYREVVETLEKLRAKYLFHVHYNPPSEAFGNRKRTAKILFKEDLNAFQNDLNDFSDYVKALKEKYAKRIMRHLVEKLHTISGLSKNQLGYFICNEGLQSKFNPRLSYEFNKISPEIYDDNDFKQALHNALFKLSKEGKIRKIEVSTMKGESLTIDVDNTGLEKYDKCNGEIDTLYELQFPGEKQVTKDSQATKSVK